MTVNSVLPGPTLSEGVAEMLKDTMVAGQSLEDAGAALVKAIRPSSIIQRAASAEEVANMIGLCLLATGFRHQRRCAAR